MRTITLLTFLTLLAPIINAQNIVPQYYDTLERKQEINIRLSGELATTSLTNAIAGKLLFGGTITRDLAQKSFDQQKDVNRAGFYTEPTIEYALYNVRPFKSKPWGLLLKAGVLYSGSARYSQGLHGLTFLGNEPFLGKKISLDNNDLSFTGAHKLSFGFIDAITKSNVTLNIYGITNYYTGYLNNSSFQQDQTGFNAELILSGNYQGTTNSPFYKGVGVGVDANFYFKLGNPEKPSFLQFSITNLGIGILSKNVSQYQMDTTLYYDGYTIGSLIDGNTLFGDGKNIPDEIGLHEDTISKTYTLPFSVHIAKIIDEHNTNKFQFFGGARMYFQNGALPMVYAGAHYRSQKWFRIGLGASYGGFTGFRANLYLQAAMKNFNVGVATTDLLGMVGVSKGYALTLNLSYRLY